ncbi:MAG: FAD:protein FMN transferase [Burkholderiales bacterium]
MHSSPEPLVARAWIALGTLVEIALPQSSATEARFEAAFAAIGHVHRCMSPREPESDLARIARDAHRGGVRVDRDTHAVLALALEVWSVSGGAFDPTLGPRGGGLRALSFEPGVRVRASRAVSLDLGGIAKGHAVDRAIEALAATGATWAVVNAGGDLRVLGDTRWHRVRVRHPIATSRLIPLCDLRDGALATSGAGFGSTLVHPRTRRACRVRDSISVAAASCAVADALTKVVALAPRLAPRVLEHFGAQAFVIDASGRAMRAGARPAGKLLQVAWAFA